MARPETPPCGACAASPATINDRNLQRGEKDRLVAVQEGLGRVGASCASLIPIRKSAAWWALTQEKGARSSKSNPITSPSACATCPPSRDACTIAAICRKTNPSTSSPGFEFALEHEAAFDKMLAELRATPKWGFVEREVELRLSL